MTRPSEEGIQVFRSSPGYRVGAGAAAGAAFLLFAFIAISDDVRFAVFGIIGAFALADTLRSEVRVDLDRRMVFSRRAIRTWSGSFEDIDAVRVPPWGPVLLTLDPRRSTPGTGLWRGQVTTGVQAQRTGSNGQACRIADLLGVEVVSVWPQGEAGSRQRSARPPRTVAARHRFDFVAVVATICVLALVGLTAWRLLVGP